MSEEMENSSEAIDNICKDREIIDSFISEAKEHLETIEDDFLSLEEQKDAPDQELLDKVFRAVHSVKGAAGFLGLENMTRLAHVMETILARMREGEMKPESVYIDALLAGVDFLSAMLDDISNSNAIDISAILERLSKIIDQEKEVAAKPAKIDLSCDLQASDVSAYQPEEEGGQQIMRDDKTPPAARDKKAVDFSNTIRIHVDVLDRLMTLAGEMVLVRNQLLRHLDESKTVPRSISQRIDMVTSELQETIILTRMQPMSKIFGKFPRIVRDMGKKLNKKIKLDIDGSEAELDKTILESLADPMTHIIRNCCDHGIETPEERISMGKPASGRISIKAYHEAGRVNIEIGDDGRGIDLAAIKKKALKQGLKSEAELDQMGEKEIYRLLFLPGFTTADKVSSVSGRGVGMDVVKTGIDKLGGVVDIESTLGEGTGIHLRLPLTLAIIPCLIVKSGDFRYAVPQSNLVEMVCLYDEAVRAKIECADDQEVYRLRDHLLPMVRLSEILANPKRFSREVRARITQTHSTAQHRAWENYLEEKKIHKDAEFSQSLNFAVLKVGDGLFGLIVDQILGTEEIVVKPMHSTMKSLGIYSGATIMGDGRVALILDTDGIAMHAGIMQGGRITASAVKEKIGKDSKDEDMQTVLLFKYGEKEQFAMALPLIKRIEKISMDRVEKVGEREFITIDDTPTRLLRLDQVLSVSPMMQRNEMFLVLPRHIKRPVGLLVSNLVDIEETAIEMNVDSFMEDGLLGTDVIRGALTLFIDIYRITDKIEPEWFAERRIDSFGETAAPLETACHILLLEDASFFRYLIKGYLEADGYRVTAAENGDIGLEHITNTNFDLVVSDLEMPVMNGWDFMRHVRQKSRQPNIPAIALTSLDTEYDRARALKSGFDRYEVKMDRERFLTAVASLLDLKRQRTQT
jgi:two-component system chemotaxis sensor kinase CheA